MHASSDHSLNRRAFLKTLGAGAGAAALAAGGASAQEPAPARPIRERMPTRVFGRSGIHVPILSLGGIVDFSTTQLLLRQAKNWGVTYWDTAHGYNGGKSEEGIGKYFGQNKDARKGIFLVTKSPAREPKALSEHLAQSFQRMGVDSIDLFFIHAVKDAAAEMTKDVLAWGEEQKKQGRIKLFGFSTHNNMPQCLQAAARMPGVDGVMFTYNYRLMQERDMNDAVAAAHAAGIGLTAMKTQGGGSVRADSEAEVRMAGRFLQRGFTEGQAKLLAVWSDERIAAICSQMPSVNLLMANISAALNDARLDAKEFALLRAHDAETRAAYCAGCTALCEGAMGGAAEIGAVMRALMYREYGDMAYARETIAALPEPFRTRMTALDYGPAESACPRGLPIAQLVRSAAAHLA